MSLRKCSVCDDIFDSFNGVFTYDDGDEIFTCDGCFLVSDLGQELLDRLTTPNNASTGQVATDGNQAEG